jgi:Zn-dependent alcohol dehydrogenase
VTACEDPAETSSGNYSSAVMMHHHGQSQTGWKDSTIRDIVIYNNRNCESFCKKGEGRSCSALCHASHSCSPPDRSRRSAARTSLQSHPGAVLFRARTVVARASANLTAARFSKSSAVVCVTLGHPSVWIIGMHPQP